MKRRFNIIIFGRSLGFTLTELLIVVVIVGILSTLALPMLIKTLEKARAFEAVTNLVLILTGQKMYFLENGYYSKEISSLNIEDPNDAPDRDFDYSITYPQTDPQQVLADNFTALADRRDTGPDSYNYNYFIDKTGEITSDGPFYPDP